MVGTSFPLGLISIHAPLRGRPRLPALCRPTPDFNPRPLAGATTAVTSIAIAAVYFNPRPLAGATLAPLIMMFPVAYFNPRPLAGATVGDVPPFPGFVISIHAPLRGRPYHLTGILGCWIFQSTPPCGGDLFCPGVGFAITGISIHAPLRGRPPPLSLGARRAVYFNPRPLAGATKLAFVNLFTV